MVNQCCRWSRVFAFGVERIWSALNKFRYLWADSFASLVSSASPSFLHRAGIQTFWCLNEIASFTKQTVNTPPQERIELLAGDPKLLTARLRRELVHSRFQRRRERDDPARGQQTYLLLRQVDVGID